MFASNRPQTREGQTTVTAQFRTHLNPCMQLAIHSRTTHHYQLMAFGYASSCIRSFLYARSRSTNDPAGQAGERLVQTSMQQLLCQMFHQLEQPVLQPANRNQKEGEHHVLNADGMCW